MLRVPDANTTVAFVLTILVTIAIMARFEPLTRDYLGPQTRPPRPWQRLALVLAPVVGVVILGILGDPYLAGTANLVWLLAVSATIDAKTHRLPDVLTIWAGGVAVIGMITWAITNWLGHAVNARASLSVLSALVGALIWTLPLLMSYFAGIGIGLGDVKLAPVLGFWLGAYGSGIAFGGLASAFILGGVWALALLARGQATLKTRIAFGPFLVAGAVLAWLVNAASWW